MRRREKKRARNGGAGGGGRGGREVAGGGGRGRLVSIREGEKGGASGRREVAEKHVRQHAPHSAARSCVRSFGSL